ncbi:MAG: AAA family ATPase [Mycoplasmatales bacterium]
MYLTKIKIENFSVFKNFEWEIKNNFNIIYGENGAGKTTLIELFDFLGSLFQKRSAEKTLESWRNKLKRIDEFDQLLGDGFILSKFDKPFSHFATIDCDQPIIIELQFVYLEKNGSYKIVIDKNDEIIQEELWYATNKRKMIIFKKSNNRLNSKSLSRFINSFDFYFEEPMYSTISIFDFLFSEKKISAEDLKKNQELQLINQLATVFHINNKFPKASKIIFSSFSEPFAAIEHTYIIGLVHEKKLQKMIEKNKVDFFNFVSEIDNQIIDIGFHKTILNEDVKYELFFKKQIGDKEIEIPFAQESSGTKLFLEYYNLLKSFAQNKNTIYAWDEIDLHMHANLSIKLLELVKQYSEKNNIQFFVTTHNQNLLNSHFLKNKEKCIVTINPLNGQRQMIDLSGVDTKDNNAKKYSMGLYARVPGLSHIFWEPND